MALGTTGLRSPGVLVLRVTVLRTSVARGRGDLEAWHTAAGGKGAGACEYYLSQGLFGQILTGATVPHRPPRCENGHFLGRMQASTSQLEPELQLTMEACLRRCLGRTVRNIVLSGWFTVANGNIRIQGTFWVSWY